MLLCALTMVAVAQLNINLIINGFKISLGVIFFPVFYFLIEDFRTVFVTMIVAPGVLFLRALLAWATKFSLGESILNNAPEMIFYLLYGVLFWMLTKKLDFRKYHLSHFLYLMGIDFLSNLGELLVRLGGGILDAQILQRIAVVAVGRSLLAALIIGAFSLYSDLTLRRDERERYKKLLFLVSQMKGELIWMNKNTAAIEKTMAISYQLYNELSQSSEPQLAQKALTVAKDVHEVKKEYKLIIKGLSEALNTEIQEKGMWISYLLEILQEGTEHLCESLQKQAHLEVVCTDDFYTNQHYYLMSILRNLLTNALEALEEGEAHLLLCVEKAGDEIVFSVEDDCGGIEEEYLELIFHPGFSTKFSETTGEVNRGLGLPLVHDMVTQKLGGTITVQPKPGGTRFEIRIPAEKLEVIQE